MPEQISNEPIEQTLFDYKEAANTAARRKAILCDALGELVGSRIDISGFPETVQIEIQRLPRKVVKRSVPVYRMFSEPEERNVYDVAGCTLQDIKGDSVQVTLDPPAEEERIMYQPTGYIFPLDQIVNISLACSPVEA